MHLLGGLDRPTSLTPEGDRIEPAPSIVVEGEDTTALDETGLASLRNAKLGFVFQFHYLLKEFTAQENVALPMFRLGRLSRKAALDRAASLLDDLGLGDKVKRRATRLSGGEQQRVAIARALANEPDLLLADEPPATSTARTANSSPRSSKSSPPAGRRSSWSPTTPNSPAGQPA